MLPLKKVFIDSRSVFQCLQNYNHTLFKSKIQFFSYIPKNTTVPN